MATRKSPAHAKASAPEQRRVAALTSGGDSPGMNMALYAIFQGCVLRGYEPYAVYEGYKGLVNDAIATAPIAEAESRVDSGGTFLYTARLPEFSEPAVRERAAQNLKRRGISDLVVIGGDGSYQGAHLLSRLGINTVCLPGTIDNDVASSDYTIGFYSAFESICRAVRQIRDTCISHRRAAIVEVMGRYCGDLALYAGMTTHADLIVTEENYVSPKVIAERAKKAFARNMSRRTFVVIVSEHLYGEDGHPPLEAISEAISEATGMKTNINKLGYIQRGGTPAPMDRLLA